MLQRKYASRSFDILGQGEPIQGEKILYHFVDHCFENMDLMNIYVICF